MLIAIQAINLSESFQVLKLTITLASLKTCWKIFVKEIPTSELKNNILYLEGLNKVDGIKSIEITSSLGARIASFIDIQNELDINELPAGTYFLNVTHNQGVNVIRFVKQ